MQSLKDNSIWEWRVLRFLISHSRTLSSRRKGKKVIKQSIINILFIFHTFFLLMLMLHHNTPHSDVPLLVFFECFLWFVMLFFFYLFFRRMYNRTHTLNLRKITYMPKNTRAASFIHTTQNTKHHRTLAGLCCCCCCRWAL